MDPGNHTATFTRSVLDPMYEGLTRFNQQLQIVPALATELKASSDATIWTAKLRQNVFFHDGSRLDPAAAAASFTRLLDPARGLAGASSFRAAVQTVKPCGPEEICFFLKQPYAAMPNLLAITPIVSPLGDLKRDLDRRADGTGPYVFSEWKTGDYVLEKRNEHYWGPKPKVRLLKWIWSTESSLMNMALVAREIDLVNPLPPVFAEALCSDKNVRLIEGKSAAVFWIALNVLSKPLNDVRVRRALNYAIDRNALIRSQLRGYGLPANSPLAPADFAYDPAIRGYAYDLAKAKALLSSAGCTHGFSLNLAVQEGQTGIAQAIAGMWAQVNVTLNIRQMETGVYAQSIFGGPQQKRDQDIQAVFASWTSSSLDAEYQLGPLYRTKSWAPAGANLGFYSNGRLDAILNAAARELDLNRRKELYAQAQEIIITDAPHVLLYYSKDLAAARATLKEPWIFPGGEVQLENE
jgi:glutathione transport system substrate-binding protein